MKKILMLTAVCLMALSCVRSDSGDIIKVGDDLPQFTLHSEIYGDVSSAELKGKVTLICFFATWCPPCQEELADVQGKLVPAFAENENFRLLVVGREHTDAELQEYNETKKFTFNLYPDPKREVYSLFAEKSVPRSYLVGMDGKIVEAHIGYEEEEFDAMMDTIRTLLK